MNNRLYLFFKNIDSRSDFFFFIIFIPIFSIIVNINYYYEKLQSNEIFNDITCLFTIIYIIFFIVYIYYKGKYNNGSIKFNKELYDIPKEGDILITSKKFYYDYLSTKIFSNKIYHSLFGSQHFLIKINKWQKIEVKQVLDIDDDWILVINSKKSIHKMFIKFPKSHKYLKTKSEIRKDKLNKLKIFN